MLSTHRLQICLVKSEYLRSLQLCEDQGTREKLKKRVCSHLFAILTTYIETRLKCFQEVNGSPSMAYVSYLLVLMN